MKPPIIGHKVNDEAIDSLIDTLESICKDEDVLYVGYPIASIIDTAISVPAMLISSRYGLICFDVMAAAQTTNLSNVRDRQRRIVLAIKSKLLQHPDLSPDLDLAVPVNIVTYSLAVDVALQQTEVRVANSNTLKQTLEGLSRPRKIGHKNAEAYGVLGRCCARHCCSMAPPRATYSTGVR